MEENSSIAAFAAAAAILGLTTEARKATVVINGLPDLEKGMGWSTAIGFTSSPFSDLVERENVPKHGKNSFTM